MNKRPAMQFYPGDWWRANDIKGCSMTTQGVWFNLLMAMWDEPEQGKIETNLDSLCRVIGAKTREVNAFLREAREHKFADIAECNGTVTVTNRRMYSAFLEREATKRRVQEHRKRQSNTNVTDDKNQECNANVTAPSSTSSSTSKEYMSFFDKSRKEYPGTKRGLQTEFDDFCRKHKDWQKALPLLLPAVLQQRQVRDSAPVGSFVPSWKNFKTWLYNRCWEDESGKPDDVSDDGLCVVDKQPGVKSCLNNGKKVWLCEDCLKAWGKTSWGAWSYGVIETRVLAAKARR